MILYIGNKLSEHGFTPTSVETLGVKLQSRYSVTLVSNKKNKAFRLVHAVSSIIKSRKITRLVLIDTYSTSNLYYALLSAVVCRVLKIPYIPILHGSGLPDVLKQSPLLSRQIFGNSVVNVSPSHFLASSFQKRGYRVKYIPNYIDVNAYSPKLREAVRPKLLYVRSFHEIYNPSMAVKVLNELAKEYEDASLCMVGPDKDGSQKDIEKLAAELGLTDQLVITGKLSKSEWTKLSAGYDIFINTTNFDNLPVSVIEALCLGLPVISTNVGGIPFLINDGVDGFLVKVNNVTEMVNQVKKLVNNSELSACISQNAVNRAKQFDWGGIEPIWGEIIDPLVIENRSGVA